MARTPPEGDRATGNGYKEMRNLKDLRLPMNPSQVPLLFFVLFLFYKIGAHVSQASPKLTAEDDFDLLTLLSLTPK